MSASNEDRAASRRGVTHALDDLSEGLPRADTRLLDLVYGELKRMAAACMRVEAREHTLQPTALVHEAYVRLVGAERRFEDSRHFFVAASAAMRAILVDHAREKKAQKRGGDAARVTLHPDLIGEADGAERILLVHEALERFAREHPRQAQVIELLFFAGLSAQEAAGVLEVSDRTVKRDWRFGRAWLLNTIEGD